MKVLEVPLYVENQCLYCRLIIKCFIL